MATHLCHIWNIQLIIVSYVDEFFSPVSSSLSFSLRSLQVSVKIILSISSLTIVTLQVEAGVVSARGVAHVVLREPVLVLPPLHALLGAQLGDGEVFLPVMSPVKFSWRRLARSKVL